MGTKVQCKNYLPVNYLTRNLNEDSTNSLSLYYEDKSLSGHLYDGCMRTPVKGYPVNGKDIFKQTMMEHEAVFKKQVGELHRLYRKQRDLMHELKNQELYRLPVQMETSGCYIYSSPMPSETTQKMWQMPHLIPVNTGYNIVHSAGTEEVKPSLNLMQFNELSTETSISIDGKLLDSKLKYHPKRWLDLQLPADVYIDMEVSERTSRENIPRTPLGVTDKLNSIYDLDHEREVKLTLSINGDRSCSSSSRKFDPHQQNGWSINSLSGLNGPMKDLACEGEAGLVSNNFIDMRTLHGEIQSNQMPDGSNRSFQPRDFFTENHRDEGAFSNFVNTVKEEVVRESPAFNYEEGTSTNGVDSFYPGISTDKCPLLCGPSQQKLKRAHKTSPGHSEEEQSRFGEKSTLGIDTYPNSSQLTQPDYSLVTTPQVHSPFSATALSESTSFLSPLLLSSRRKPVITYTPIAVQALPCFSQKETMKFRNRNLHKSVENYIISQETCGDIKESPRYGSESLSYQNGVVYHDMCSNPSSAQVEIGGDSIAYEEYEGNGSLRFFKSQIDVSFSRSIPNATRGKGKHPESSEGPSLFGTKPPCTVPEMNQSLQDSSHSLVKMRKKGRSEFVSEITMEDLIPFEKTLDDLAAENLVAISLSLRHSSAAACCESLHWLAEVISSEGAHDETSNIDDSSRLDLFESMTLELEEVKPEDHLLWPREQESQTNGNEHGASLVLAKTRRGQARKRRQRKDFRRDILPGLALLSRDQVTEDLQAFDIIMMGASGSRKGSICRGRGRGRGRRRPGGLAIVVTDVNGVSPNPAPVTPLVPTGVPEVNDVTPLVPTEVTGAYGPVKASVANETEVVGRGVMGWGRTKRKGRRPRVRKGWASPFLTVNYEL